MKTSLKFHKILADLSNFQSSSLKNFHIQPPSSLCHLQITHKKLPILLLPLIPSFPRESQTISTQKIFAIPHCCQHAIHADQLSCFVDLLTWHFYDIAFLFHFSVDILDYITLFIFLFTVKWVVCHAGMMMRVDLCLEHFFTLCVWIYKLVLFLRD